MREILERKLSNPQWLAEAHSAYDDILAGNPRNAIPLVSSPGVVFQPLRDMPMPSTFMFPVDLETLPEFEDPTTVDALWLDRWQRSLGGYTITRTLDDTVQLDYPEGVRFVYQIALTDEGYSWIAEEFNPGGRRLKTYRTTEIFDNYEQVLFEMHRAAIAEFDELTNEY